MKSSNDGNGSLKFALFMFGIAFCLFVGLIVYGLIAVNHPGKDPTLIIKFYEDAVFSTHDEYKKVEKIIRAINHNIISCSAVQNPCGALLFVNFLRLSLK